MALINTYRVSIQDFHKGQERECLPDSRFKHNVLQQKILLFYRIDILDFTKVVLKLKKWWAQSEQDGGFS